MSVWRYWLWFLVAASTLSAQVPVVEPDRRSLLDRVINGEFEKKTESLKCTVQTFSPFLDFAFRFEAGYVVRCPLAQFQGEETAIAAYLRIQPARGPVSYLGESFHLPAMPEAMRTHYSWNHLRQEAELSGVFAAGVGEYNVNLILVDPKQHIFQKHWKVKIAPRGSERKAELSIPPNTVLSAASPPWHGPKPERSGPGPRLTVLLDAAPVFPSSQKLRAWDRAFLMSSLASLLRGIQPSAVRLIAFNLEQQREVYREDRFDRQHFVKLSEALSQLELGTVSYKTLQHQFGWADLLTGLVGRVAKDEAAGTVVFLGPNVRNQTKIPRELVSCESLGTRLNYLEFFPIPGYEFPDTIHQLINTCHGTVFRMRSPGDLAAAIGKLQNKVPGQP